MNQTSIVSKVTPFEECPMCGEESIRLTNSCPINNPDHKICEICVTNLREKYNKDFCAYCGERPIIINIPISVEPQHESLDITIETTTEHEQSRYHVWKKENNLFINIIGGTLSYIGLIYNWHLYRMLDHYIEEGEILNEEVDWHIYNAFYALFIDVCLVFLIVYMCEDDATRAFCMLCCSSRLR